MSFPGGGQGGYPGQGPQQPQQAPGYGPPQPQGNPLAGMNMSTLLALGVTLLGVVAYFIGFSDEATPASDQIQLLLAGGLLCAFRAIPSASKVFLQVGAVLSTLGGLALLDLTISVPSGAKTPGILVVLLILGILQMLVAVAALLFDIGVLKMPPPQPQYPGYGPPSGQFPAQQPPPGQYQPGAQTQYQPQPGQFPPPPPQQHPGTPPGGYPQQG